MLISASGGMTSQRCSIKFIKSSSDQKVIHKDQGVLDVYMIGGKVYLGVLVLAAKVNWSHHFGLDGNILTIGWIVIKFYADIYIPLNTKPTDFVGWCFCFLVKCLDSCWNVLHQASGTVGILFLVESDFQLNNHFIYLWNKFDLFLYFNSCKSSLK